MTRLQAARAIEALRAIVSAANDAEAADRDRNRPTGEWTRWWTFTDLIAQARAALDDIDAGQDRRPLFGDLTAEFIQDLLTAPPRGEAAE